MQDLLSGTGIVCLYLAIAASTLVFLRSRITINDELFRKLLHFVLLLAYIPFVFAFDVWWHAIVLAVVIEVIAYPALMLAGRIPRFSSFVNERSKGEFKSSLLLAFTMLAVCIAVCWGWLQERLLVLACMYAWGVGDALAALVGKAYGRHKIHLRHTGATKSLEGSAAMFASSMASVAVVLLFWGKLNPAAALGISAAAAAVSAVVELLTPNGLDTITCPTAAMLVILPLTAFAGGFA